MQESEHLAAFKQQLGIHHTEDEYFGWIAEVGLQSPLPPRWTSHTDPGSGFMYYVDHDHQSSSWENPLVPHLRRIVEIGRAYLENPSETFFEDQKGILWHQHKHALDCWHGPFADHQGRQYFVNSSEGVSSWQDPRVDAQYLFELESGLLTSLEEVLPPPPMDSPQFGTVDLPDAFGGGGETAYCDEPWRTAEGAEVLTIGDSRLATARTQKRLEAHKSQANLEAREDHKSTLERMAATADRVRRLHQDEEEAQRINFKRKAEVRRRERIASASQARPASRPVPAPLGAAAAPHGAPPRTPPQVLPPLAPPAPAAGFLAAPPSMMSESPLGQSITSMRGGLLVKADFKQWEPLDGCELRGRPAEDPAHEGLPPQGLKPSDSPAQSVT